MDTNFITQLITGNVGTLILVLILWRSGLLKYLLNGKRNYDDGQPLTTLTEVASTVAKLEEHFNNETTSLLQKIASELHENSQKLDKISDGIIYLKARINNKNQ